MPAGLAYAFVYHQCTRGLDDDARLEVDAILGDPVAEAQVQENRRAVFANIDAEVG